MPSSALVDDADSPDSLAYAQDGERSVWRNPVTWILGALLLGTVAIGRRGGRSRRGGKVDNEPAG